MILEEDKPSLYEFEHFGIKGMHWGVHKQRTPEEKKALAKKVAIGLGVLVAVAGAAAIAYQLDKNGSLPFHKLADVTTHVQDNVEKLVKEPVSIVHTSRGHSKGFTFIKKGGLDDALPAWESAFGSDRESHTETFKRLANGNIAAQFFDPHGRIDRSGRDIPHQVVIPKSMADGINGVDDVKQKIWPLIKDTYDDFYENSKKA